MVQCNKVPEYPSCFSKKIQYAVCRFYLPDTIILF